MFYLDLFDALEKGGVRYLPAGGLALNIHEVERAAIDEWLDEVRRFTLMVRAAPAVPALQTNRATESREPKEQK